MSAMASRSQDRFWPGRAKAEFKLAAVNQSSEAGQQGKVRADHQGPVMAESGCPARSAMRQVNRGAESMPTARRLHL
jgi:hypothetical protein